MKPLEKMSKEEKRCFLSNDFAERIIRLEQGISASFNKSVKYNETEYYKSMTSQQQREFERFMKGKKKKMVLHVLVLLLPLALFFFLRASITGNAIREEFSNNFSLTNIELFLLGVFILLLITLVYRAFRNKLRVRKFEKHSKVIENLMEKKHQTSKRA